MKIFSESNLYSKSNLAKIIASYEDGLLLCNKCKKQISLEGICPLSMVECPKCEIVNFVPLVLNNFLLFRPLGGGGMGSVYKAFDPETDKFLAVKVLSREGKNSPSAIKALLNEGLVANTIGDHPCLVKCLGSGCEKGEYFCALEYVEGQRLDQIIDLEERIPPKQTLQIGLHLLAAEQHIYNCGYLYRDMKPENVIINADGYAVLVDYGLCETRKQSLDPNEEFVSGSPFYLPPERLLGEGEGACSEIYSLGMVLYYALTGETFYNASEAERLAKRHVSNLQLPISAKMKNVDPKIAKVLAGMINQNPKKRFQSFSQVAELLNVILKGL